MTRKGASKQLEFRFQPVRESELGIVYEFLLHSQKLMGKGKQRINQAVLAYWRPFAFERKRLPAFELQQLALDSALALEQQARLIRQHFGLASPPLGTEVFQKHQGDQQVAGAIAHHSSGQLYGQGLSEPSLIASSVAVLSDASNYLFPDEEDG